MEFGNRAIPWGRTIQEPTMVAGAVELVAFHATTAMDRYLYASPEAKVLSGKITAALVPVEMAVLRAISRAPITWLRACFRPPLPVRPFRAGTATAAKSPMMPTTARSSTRVNAALLRSDSVNLDELRRVLMCKGFNVRRSLKDWYVESVVGLSAVRFEAITVKLYTTSIYNVNTSLQSKCYKSKLRI